MQPVLNRAMTGRPVMALVAASVIFWFLERSSESWGFGWHYGVFGILIGWYLHMLLRDNTAATLTSFYQLSSGAGMLISAKDAGSRCKKIPLSN